MMFPRDLSKKLFVTVVALICIYNVGLCYRGKNLIRQDQRNLDLRPPEMMFITESPTYETAFIPKEFIIEENMFCFDRPDLRVIVYVHSAINRIKQRNETRFTWGNGEKIGFPLAVVFMVGNPETEGEREIVLRESKIYKDIVQGDYKDGYKFLTYKALSSIYWVTKNCPDVPWIMHADDDIMVNTYRLFQRIKVIESQSTFINEQSFYCNVFAKPKVLRRGKWKVPYKKYKHEYYPKFCQGPMWLLRTEYIPKLLEAVNKTEFWWIDDVYISGFLAIKAKIDRKPIPYLSFNKKPKVDMINKIGWLVVNEDRLAWWNNITNAWKNKT